MARRKDSLRFDWFMVAALVIVLYFSYNCIQQQSHLNAIERDYGAVRQQLEDARQKNQALRAEKTSLEGHEYIEKVAREELGMTRQGEMPYISAKH